MKSKSMLKYLIIGFIGGALPLAAYLSYNYSTSKPSERLLDGKKFHAKASGILDGQMPDLTAASESSLNSVVHVTTKVVSTTFQRDIFQEFFYGPGAGGKEFKQYGSGAGSGVIISSEGYIVKLLVLTPRPILPFLKSKAKGISFQWHLVTAII